MNPFHLKFPWLINVLYAVSIIAVTKAMIYNESQSEMFTLVFGKQVS
jgi:hypothetical protein